MNWFLRAASNTGESFTERYSAQLDGATSFFALPSDSKFNFGNAGVDSAFTLVFWAKPAAHPFRAITKGTSSANNSLIANTHSTQFKWQVRAFDGSDYIGKLSTNVATLNVWQHLVMTYDGSKTSAGFKIYKNGVDDTGVNDANGVYGGIVDSGQIQIGKWDGTSTNKFANGLIDEVAIFKGVAFSQAEVTEAYNSGQVFDMLEHSQVSSLSGYYRFENNANDSSDNDLHATATAITYSDNDLPPDGPVLTGEMYLLIGGQSNAVGRTASADPSANLQGPINGAYIHTSGSAFPTLDYPDNNAGENFGIELSFAKGYRDAHSDKMLNIAKYAVTGTPIASEVGRDDFNVATNELIVNLIAAYTALVNKATLDGAVSPKFILYWNQGERDARLLEGPNYYANFTDIKDALDAVHPLDLIIVCPLNEDIINNTDLPTFTAQGIADVRDAQLLLANDFANIEALDMNNYTLGADSLHFTGPEQERLGTDVLVIVETFFA